MSVVAHMTGPFRLETEQGVDLTPRSAKICGLLLLLLTSPNGSRERAWLQDKLWSDRGKDQGAGSLRQAIYQCKKMLGADGSLFTSTKLRVSLNLAEIRIIEGGFGEFAEGIDVRDPEFENWLTLERSGRSGDQRTAPLWQQRCAEPSPLPPTIALAIETLPGPSPLAEWFTEVTADQCSSMLYQVIGANVVGPATETQNEPEFQLTLNAVQSENGWVFMRARLREAPFGLQIWSGHRVIKSLLDDPLQNADVSQMVFEIAETIRHRFSQRPDDKKSAPPLMSSKAISNMFTMTEQGANDADHLLASAYEHDPHATHLAWRAQVRVIQFFERYKNGDVGILEESRELSSRALEKEPNNSMVLALVANSLNYLEGRFKDALSHANRAVELNPGNPFAWWTLAAAQLNNHELELAYESSQRSRELLRGSTLEFLPESLLGGSALALGMEQVALRHFERSLSFRPTFKPSLRYAIGLNAKHGNMERARKLVAALSDQEEGFKPDQLVEDGKYPTSLLRRDESVDFQLFRDLI
ncbi:hypothetical protein [Shimia sp. R9_3]|uniref:tetratricopeptide repeat protein n=1 Tax=Shimia sp. R9_3 TaxID=2821113 RepID=UPI001ADA17EB|nr:hypothetical protein [Shimia sp. R9_3]